MGRGSVFWYVYRVVVCGEKLSIDRNVLERCVEIAAKNKVLLHFLRVLDIHGHTRFREEARYRRFIKSLHMVAEVLRGLNHVFIKLRKPIAYVPADIDVLMDRNCIGEAVSKLMEKGFRIVVAEPYCITMARRDTIVDLYVYPTIGGMIYLDAGKLLEHRVIAEFDGVELPILETYAEAVLAIAHAIYKERIYTLNDYITIMKWFNRRGFSLALELNVLNAVEMAMAIHEGIGNGILTLPFKIPLPIWWKTLLSKILNDKLTRTTVLNILRTLSNPRIGDQVISKIVRETY